MQEVKKVQKVRVKLPRYLPLSYVTELQHDHQSVPVFFFFVLLYEREQS